MSDSGAHYRRFLGKDLRDKKIVLIFGGITYEPVLQNPE